ncbi:MAG: hypothetical protein QM778_13245 [Myxococcales bacterium]
MYAWVAFLVLCAAGAPSRTVQAQLREHPEVALTDARAALEKARFDVAKQRAQRLLERSDLDARTRNAALELSAIIDTAARRERAAQATLAELYARDPLHPRRVYDPGPAVETAFAKAHARTQGPVQVAFSALTRRQDDGTLLLQLRIYRGANAVESMHVRLWLPGENADPVEVSAVLGLREQLSLTLPTPLSYTGPLPVVMEARSPGGYVLGHIGSLETPAQLAIPPGPPSEPVIPACPAPERRPLRREWWLWTSVGVVVTGLAFSAGYLAQ